MKRSIAETVRQATGVFCRVSGVAWRDGGLSCTSGIFKTCDAICHFDARCGEYRAFPVQRTLFLQPARSFVRWNHPGILHVYPAGSDRAVAADAVENSKKQFWYEWFAGMAGMLLPVLFYYLTYREISVRIMVSAVADGVVVFCFASVLPEVSGCKKCEVDEVMVDITDEPIRWRGNWRVFSRADYSHARRVMLVAARCAAVVGADERVQRRGDVLPYRRTGGRTACKNGVKWHRGACFPEKVIRIIGEYNGEEALPSTIESAIVHMVDGLLKNWRFWMRIPLAATGTRIW